MIVWNNVKKHLKYMAALIDSDSHLQMLTLGHLFSTGEIVAARGDGCSIVVLKTKSKLPDCSLNKIDFTEFCKTGILDDNCLCVDCPDKQELLDYVPDKKVLLGGVDAKALYQATKALQKRTTRLFVTAWFEKNSILIDLEEDTKTQIKIPNLFENLTPFVVFFDVHGLYQCARVLSPANSIVALYHSSYNNKDFVTIYMENPDVTENYAVLSETQPRDRRLKRPKIQ